VERWHGRRFEHTAPMLRDAAIALHALLAGEVAAPKGYRLRLPAVPASITIAAFGPATVRVAAEIADRVVINMCTPAQAGLLREQLDAATDAAGRGRITLAAWVPAAVDPTDAAIDQLRRGVVAYLAAPGYGEMFAAAGFAELVALARSGAHPGEVLAAVPRELVDAIGIVGSVEACRSRIAAHVAAGVDEVVVVAATADDPAGERTLTALAPVP
jgi:probable F420-dependent oxidoreductase